MKNKTYPDLLNKRAKIIASLTRIELVVLALFYLIFSWCGVSGFKAFLLNVQILIFMKIIGIRVERGFLTHLRKSKDLRWNYKIGELYE